jgi:uncharacterized membrane protein
VEKTYNRIAGHSLERIGALSDGVFAIAMTLIVLEIRVPENAKIHSEGDVLNALIALAPQIVTYLLSFLTLGIFWVGQQTQLSLMRESDRNLAWIHFVFLAMVAILPFSTSLLSRFIEYRTALIVYWLNIVALGAAIYASWSYAKRAKLLGEAVTDGVDRAVRARIVYAQALYAFGALLSLYSTYVSIAFIVLLQLYYAVAPRLGRLARFEH